MTMSTRKILEMIVSFLECCVCLGRFIPEGVPLWIPGAAFQHFKDCSRCLQKEPLFRQRLPSEAHLSHKDCVPRKGKDGDSPLLQWVIREYTM